MLAQQKYESDKIEAQCIACILFVVKLEADFCSNLSKLFSFVKNRLKLSWETIWSAERDILLRFPANLALIPSLSELITAVTHKVNLPLSPTSDLHNLWKGVMERYICLYANFLSVDDLVLQPALIACVSPGLAKKRFTFKNLIK